MHKATEERKEVQLDDQLCTTGSKVPYSLKFSPGKLQVICSSIHIEEILQISWPTIKELFTSAKQWQLGYEKVFSSENYMPVLLTN